MTLVVDGAAEAGSPDGASHSRLTWLKETASGKRFFVMRQRGSFAEICRHHGRLLGAEMEAGLFAEVVDTIRTGVDADNASVAHIQRCLYRRTSQAVFASVSAEFKAGVEGLYRGYAEARPRPKFDLGDAIDACLAIDAGNIATGLAKRLEQPLHTRNSRALGYLIGAVLGGPGERDPEAEQALRRRSGEIGAGLGERLRARPLGMGCTAFALSPGRALSRRGLHARSFDGAFFSWNEAPGVFIVDERGHGAARYRYAAVGAAGLIYPGGISGVNEQGLACSLHQMSTINYSTGGRRRRWDIAPFVMQRILREAGTLDEAVQIARSVRHFASWTILVSDAKTGLATAIEINGRDDAEGDYAGQVRALPARERVIQANHFLHSALEERFGHGPGGDLVWDNAHFTHSVGKWMETRARVHAVDWRLATLPGGDRPNTEAAMGVLADHLDIHAGNRLRAFGRCVVKAYGQMASIVRADEDRAAPEDELWFTIGDARPGNHSRWAGFRIDWGALDLTPVTPDPVARPTPPSPRWREALGHYVDAFRTLARPRPDGDYLGRDPTGAEREQLLAGAIGALSRAVAIAEEERGEPDVTYRYARARLLHAHGAHAGNGAEAQHRWAAAAADWRVLVQLARSQSRAADLHDYDRARIFILAAATEAALERRAEADALLDSGREALRRAAVQLFPSGGVHPGVREWESTAAAIAARGEAAGLPEFDFVTVE